MILRQSDQNRGFTLVELLAVITTIAILAALLLPVLGKAKIKAQRANCQSNLHQLGLAWEMYHIDNNGRLVESYPVNNKNAWILGDMRSPSEAENPELIPVAAAAAADFTVAAAVPLDVAENSPVSSFSLNAQGPVVGHLPTRSTLEYATSTGQSHPVVRPSRPGSATSPD